MTSNDTLHATTGRVTLPAEAGMEKRIRTIARQWGADAVRDSDGTTLSDEILSMGFTVYSVLCLIREDNEWAKAHPEYLQQTYLLSERVPAFTDHTNIEIMRGHFAEQFRPDLRHDPSTWWEVIDRTTGAIVPPTTWGYEATSETVQISGTVPGHLYTVAFLADQLWEPVSMYNHLTNGWSGEHRMPVDPRHPEARAHLLSLLEDWLDRHPGTDVVRFTTFVYNFDLAYDEKGKERRVDWFGYAGCASAVALEDFARERGYRLHPEDIVDEGYYNSPFRNPSQRFLDWMDFNQAFVSCFARECVERVHRREKRAIMFLGDQWAGTEPYGTYFSSIGLDGVVGASGDGVTTRMITDIATPEREVRFYPYLFPDVFHPGGDPVAETNRVWIGARRALMRSPADRMGYGGYLSLASEFPDFITQVELIADQFRQLHERSGGTRPYSAPFEVAVLNRWGELRRWMTHQVAHSLWHRRCYALLGAMEALAGLNVEVRFLSFHDVVEEGVPEGVGVIMNVGEAGTSWSGGEEWRRPELVSAVRSWVSRGGGFIGIGESTATAYAGAYFQLSDVLGVEEETGSSLSNHATHVPQAHGHFITIDQVNAPDFGEATRDVHVASADTHVLRSRGEDVCLSVHAFGSGRAVYIAGLPFNLENSRLLHRAIYWAAGEEKLLTRWFSSNQFTECHAYPEAGWCALLNNTDSPQSTRLYDGEGQTVDLLLDPCECRWLPLPGAKERT